MVMPPVAKTVLALDPRTKLSFVLGIVLFLAVFVFTYFKQDAITELTTTRQRAIVIPFFFAVVFYNVAAPLYAIVPGRSGFGAAVWVAVITFFCVVAGETAHAFQEGLKQ